MVALSEVIRASSGSTNAARSVASVVGMPGVLTGPGVIGGPVGGMSGLSGLSSGITGKHCMRLVGCDGYVSLHILRAIDTRDRCATSSRFF